MENKDCQAFLVNLLITASSACHFAHKTSLGYRTPNRSSPVDGFVTVNFGLFNRELGSGVGQGLFRFLPSIPGESFKLIARFAFQFPDLSNV